MQAVTVIPSEKKVDLLDHPNPPAPTGSEVKLKILDVGVCGTDREIVNFDYGNPPKGEKGLIIGHESLGEVIEIGKKVKDFKVGDLAVTMVRRPCKDPNCTACQNGRQDFCYSGKFTERGINGRNGFMTEQIIDDEKYMFHVPSQLREFAVLTEPLTIAEKAVTQVYDIQRRLPWVEPQHNKENAINGQLQNDPLDHHTALVLGAGPVGLLGAMKLCIEGYNTTIYSREGQGSDKAKFAQRIGAGYLSAEDVKVCDVSEKLGNIDLVYEATGASTLAYQALEELGVNGVFCFTGVPGRKGPIEINVSTLMRRQVLENQVIFGTVNAGRQAYINAVKDLGEFETRWTGAAGSLITGRHKIEDAVELLQSNWRGIKNIIEIGK